jgi:uncharacterized protein YjeT (DUF2065 family)
MSDFVAALGLVLVIEGLLWAASPMMATRILHAAAEMPEQVLRFFGLAAIGLGVLVVWLVRG